ncbi:SAM-dependent methyltransferase [Nocardioides gansuensis]|uniref:SAM-dependent methyltransferase n=1 Tax=Nocardioides gansuensis TaxID=2138300 RepID=A0A2T8F5E5_9ACTN|nr:class I SAM-dependent methyltransferase [Nocardioides gansuensis]PVG80951.1 SAM-dependent methyltransferase [Nocardioides gansuensis]
MAFTVDGTAYDRFMGRYSEPLADQFVEWARVRPGMKALDVGCGPGALTARLVDRLGADAVTAVDPSPSFLASLQERLPGVDARRAGAEAVPFHDDTFDVVTAQLVVHFMKDALAGFEEMTRVAVPGGTVSACTWDLAGDRSPISPLWRAVRDLDPSVKGEEKLPGTDRGELGELARSAGLTDVEESELAVIVTHPSFEEWWEPYTLGVGPSGDYVVSLDEEHRAALRERCRELLPPAPFQLEAVAWTVRGRAV